ncbi:CRISPR-associated helicase/endonuclease Cas3 [Corynebacterium epidermidicanis]|uniref:CRISPR-associated helicase Cas3/CRISPR-associated endonuclease Cas3-HD n=1 Tax=Corynebacterium epidermidicanis TaxID=1050174 RepID=A0A0G3GN43_9CORY|nr:CRISPR-associated helicase/endonuclease Cas3 [Corynebacterium epidermidicanis]AKK01975.1 CRISPR-associated helicase Cas3/CRISPR-associated endonuclease Cas3-HD [Corynebacterium epidermidicanis]
MTIVTQADRWLIDRSLQVNALWAKSGTEEAYLHLPQHLIDTACVAEWLWDNWVSAALKTALSRTWSLNEDHLRRLYVFLAGTHDVGKATVSFQRQAENPPSKSYLLAEVETAGLSLAWTLGEGTQKLPHGTASALILRGWLQKWGIGKLQAVRVSSVVDAHHGFATDPKLLELHQRTIPNYPEAWASIHAEILDTMAELTDIEDVLDAQLGVGGPYAAATQLMTGLVIMADWIASNEDLFPYRNDQSQVERVEAAMAAVQLPSPWQSISAGIDTKLQFQNTFGWPDYFEVRPVQDAAVQIARSHESPCLMIIEAPTGEGKTEAGLAAAHVIGEKTGAQGVFVAAPTMSTANGLFERTTDWVRRSSQSGEVASMYLAHSKNQLSEQYQALRFSGIGSDTLDHGSVVANQWLSGRRKGILADFVVGTVDQVLMMVLQARFSMLRHVGLAGKVIIIDEVHAYDAYMSQYLYRTLEWLANYGVSVILMSATLPPAQRKDLAAAYASQLVTDPDLEKLNTSAYPLISTVSAAGIATLPIASRPTDLEASLTVLDDSLDTLVNQVKALLVDGGVALIICNTIARSQAAFDALSSKFPGDVDLHHSAFVAAHRSAKEDLLREMLGPQAHRGSGRPDRKIVVATQVAEQSLDIDADVLVTDIAPIDLVIQRIGRLHRHRRPDSDRPLLLQEPQVFIRGIQVIDPLPEFDGGAEAVYGRKLLLATMAHLPAVFRRPDDVAELVRNVYAENPAIPTGWSEAWREACQKASAERFSAERRADAFRFPAPGAASEMRYLFDRLHSEPKPGEEEVGNAQVRDAELTVEAIAIQKDEYGYRPLGSDEEIQIGSDVNYGQALALAAHSIRLPARLTRRGSDFDEVIGDLEMQTPGEWSESGILKGQVALIFNTEGFASAGRFTLRYDLERGLEVVATEAVQS